MEEMKHYELAKLTSDHLFLMCKIMSKVGMKRIREAFDSDEVKEAVKDAAAKKAEGATDDTVNETVGMTVVIQVAGVIIEALPDCKKEIYDFLSTLSGLKKDEIAALPMADFIGMIIDVVKKDEFKDFFGAAGRLFK